MKHVDFIEIGGRMYPMIITGESYDRVSEYFSKGSETKEFSMAKIVPILKIMIDGGCTYLEKMHVTPDASQAWGCTGAPAASRSDPEKWNRISTEDIDVMMDYSLESIKGVYEKISKCMDESAGSFETRSKSSGSKKKKL